MRNFFNYESKFMQILLIGGDLILMNLLYLLCCIPVFTIGAAQAGLYSAIGAIMDREKEEYPSRAFFKGFRSGFGRITLQWCGLLVLIGLISANLVAAAYYGTAGSQAAVWMSVFALCLAIPLQSILTPFHARFACDTPWQLFRSAWFFLLAHPLRGLLVALLTWLPVVLAALRLFYFMQLTMVWLAIYYSIAFLFNLTILRKPFQRLEDALGTSPAADKE